MTYPDNYESKIGFAKIRAYVKEATLCPLGAARVDEMTFLTDEAAIVRRLSLAAEMMATMDDTVALPSENFLDPTAALRRIRLAGTFLDVDELHDVRRSLATIAALVAYFHPKETEGRRVYPLLRDRAATVETCPDVRRAADRVLTADGEVRDNASPALADIRRQLRTTVAGISRLLTNILRTAQGDGIVERDVAPVLRDGRLVIPIAAVHKRHLRGIVHDESATGKTLYVEPAEVVEANNRIRELEGEERQEIIRILTAVADEIRPWLPDLLDAYDFLGEVDYLRAVARFARRIEAAVPQVDAARHTTDWLSARHPLLYLRYKAEGKAAAVVPLDIAIDDDRRRIVLISGPNAGGKSVCLETLGLLQYMLQCGLPIPVESRSLCTVYDHIFIDIGDEQSIDNDLSTYSSHLTNMKHFLRHADRRTLLLIDEFGSGTEPQIGGAIAQAVLGRFNAVGAHGVITTHYQNLKQYADTTPGIVNAAMLYDRREMRPLFRLEIGQPGSSFALEIAHKIGLPQEVIAEAKRIVGEDYVDMDKYLQSIARDKLYWEQKRQKIHQQEKALDDRIARLDAQTADLNARRTAIVQAARDEAADLLREANARIEGTIRQIKEANAEREATRAIRRDFETYRDAIHADSEDESADNVGTRHAASAPSKAKGKTKRPEKDTPPVLKPGDAVRLSGQNVVGQIITTNGTECVVAFGMIKSTVAASRLEAVSRAQIRRDKAQDNLLRGSLSAATSDEMRERRLHFKQEIDIRGMRADDALQAVTYYMDDAILLGAGRVRILHGTGTGALRQVVRQYLATLPGVAAFHDEHVQFGGAGVTVAELE